MPRKDTRSVVSDDPVTLFSGIGTVYIRKPAHYVPLTDGDAMDTFTITIEARETLEPLERYCIVVLEEGDEALRQPIGNGMVISYSAEEGSVHWPSIVAGKVEMLAFKFRGRDARVTAEAQMTRFVEVYNRCTYAIMTDTEVEKLDLDDPFFDYVGGIATTQLPAEDYEEPMFELDVAHENAAETGTGTVCYSESMRFNRAVVVRETKNALELQAHAFNSRGFTVGDSQTIKLGGVQSCDSALLDDTEKKLLLLSVDDNRLCEVDMEYGKVVQEYKPPKKVISVAHGAHVAGPTPVYTCLAEKVAFNMDLRMDQRSNIVVEPDCTVDTYVLGSLRKPFTCHATSASGHLVIGDGAGNIRLYTGPPGSRRADGKYNPKTAKTLLETKVPVIAVDVTADGMYVLAVCAKYLLFMPTAFLDKGNESNGFVARMGRQKPKPLKLQPTPAQLRALGGIDKLNYTSGGFDRYNGGG
ncbi:vacuole import and degradation, partial [Trypanosoma grayi]|uniref:vacuole import and degradation n=1 Tax=Trypanosoma grayi TaxID=71804 RepID=UPI0004F45C20